MVEEVEFEMYGDLSFYSLRKTIVDNGRDFCYDELKKADSQFTKDQIQDISVKTGLGSSAAMTVSFAAAWLLAQKVAYISLEQKKEV